ncbi:putative polyamine transporter [Hibiscus syriacus]|uniref:Polyamine transporter n=1 Tax=Hibiscus syriacus TaxID=106335 RepID=A0A6A3BE37_HIBSY|nr:putative polyamine transporter [Hibiscus syriacus]
MCFCITFFETKRHCGIGELLEIWGSIINGFGVPLKEEHKLFLMRLLLPLHKAKGLQVYHRELAYCVTQFVHKVSALGGIVVRRILRYCPITDCHKEVFPSENWKSWSRILIPISTERWQYPYALELQDVAERALYVWNNEQFVKMASAGMEEVFPVVVESMESNLKVHWSKSVMQLTENVKSMLEEMDPNLYEKCLREIDHRQSEARREQIKRRQRWIELEMAAAKQNHFLQPTKSVYVSSH